jgi:hypothetical protein
MESRFQIPSFISRPAVVDELNTLGQRKFAEFMRDGKAIGVC